MFFTLRFSLVLCCLLALTTVSRAEEQYPCSNPDASPVDTLVVGCSPDSTLPIPLGWKVQAAQISWEEVVMSTSSGTVSLSIPVESISFSGAGADSLDPISTAALFYLIDAMAVRRALDSGWLTPPMVGTSRMVDVYQTGCVTRSGQGEETAFTAESGDCCVKTFLVSTPFGGGTPTITLVSSNGPACSGSYESTCEEEEALFSFIDRGN